MALIQCKDCANEVSDSAESCPQCGAPVPKELDTNEEQCPFCASVIIEGATVCSSCRAVQGYLYTENQGALGKVGTVFFVIVFMLPVVIYPTLGWITMPISLYGLYRLVTGPRWFQTRQVS